jgi:polar amino acid transport system permease protein
LPRESSTGLRHVTGPYVSSKRRFTVTDLAIITLLVAGAAWFVFRLAGGDLYRWNWRVITRYMIRYDSAQERWVPNVLLDGFLTTIRLSLWAGIVALFIGVVMGIVATRHRLLARLITRTYVEFARNTPPLVLVFLFYYFLGDQIIAIFGIDRWAASLGPTGEAIITVLAAPPGRFPAFVSAVVTLGVFEGAYLTEIVRAGIESVDRGQWEAGYALGFSSLDRYRFIVLPQAWRVVLPAVVGQMISVIKDSAIVAVISVPELTFQGLEVMAATYRTFEIWITIAAMYFVLSSVCSWTAHAMERKF